MVKSWIALALDIPVLDSPDDVALIHSAKHDLNFILSLLIPIVKKEIDSSTTGLEPFPLYQSYLSETQQSGF
jgi:hypothetical protein